MEETRNTLNIMVAVPQGKNVFMENTKKRKNEMQVNIGGTENMNWIEPAKANLFQRFSKVANFSVVC
jgi:hypothetical protein